MKEGQAENGCNGEKHNNRQREDKQILDPGLAGFVGPFFSTEFAMHFFLQFSEEVKL